MIERDEQKLVIRRVFRNGRRRYDASSKAHLVAECLLPGASVSRVALAHGVNANLVRKWIKAAKVPARSRRGAFAACVHPGCDGGKPPADARGCCAG